MTHIKFLSFQNIIVSAKIIVVNIPLAILGFVVKWIASVAPVLAIPLLIVWFLVAFILWGYLARLLWSWQ